MAKETKTAKESARPMRKSIEVRLTKVVPSTEQISKRAWEIWQAEGCPDGRSLEHWLRAEAELIKEL